MYWSTTVHRVTPVTRGVRDERLRALLFDLKRAITCADNDSAVLLQKIYNNLRRCAVDL